MYSKVEARQSVIEHLTVRDATRNGLYKTVQPVNTLTVFAEVNRSYAFVGPQYRIREMTE